MSESRAEAWEAVGTEDTSGGILIVADHASASVPPGKVAPASGRSTETDLKAGALSA